MTVHTKTQDEIYTYNGDQLPIRNNRPSVNLNKNNLNTDNRNLDDTFSTSLSVSNLRIGECKYILASINSYIISVI